MGIRETVRKFWSKGREGTMNAGDAHYTNPPKDGRAWLKDPESGEWEPIPGVFDSGDRPNGIDEKTGQVYVPAPLPEVPNRLAQSAGYGTTTTTTVSKPVQSTTYVACHAYGPVKVFTLPSLRNPTKKIIVYAGAGREVELSSVDGVIDLSGYNSPLEEKKGRGFNHARAMLAHQNRTFYIHIPTLDGGAPTVSRLFWEALLEDIQTDISEDVLVCCTGGHGRTGLALVVLGCLANVIPEDVDPVRWVREKYCYKAVETNAQLNYIEKVTKRVTTSEPSDEWLSQTIGKAYHGSYSGTHYNPDDWEENTVDKATAETQATIARMVKEGAY